MKFELPKIPKLKKEQWCTALQVAYHLVFAGGMITGGQHYLSEFQKTRDTIVQQADRVEEILSTNVDKVTKTANNVGNTIKNSSESIEKTKESLDSNIHNLEDALKKVQKACRF